MHGSLRGSGSRRRSSGGKARRPIAVVCLSEVLRTGYQGRAHAFDPLPGSRLLLGSLAPPRRLLFGLEALDARLGVRTQAGADGFVLRCVSIGGMLGRPAHRVGVDGGLVAFR